MKKKSFKIHLKFVTNSSKIIEKVIEKFINNYQKNHQNFNKKFKNCCKRAGKKNFFPIKLKISANLFSIKLKKKFFFGTSPYPLMEITLSPDKVISIKY